MFWVDTIVRDIEKRLKEKIASGKPLIIRDEKTPSGRVHVGSMRGVAIHGLVYDVLKEKGIGAKYIYEFNDSDPMDGLPNYLDTETFGQYMGKQLFEVPSPEEGHKNYAEYFADEFEKVITNAEFTPEFTRAHDLYTSGKMNEVIRKALDGADKVRSIYKKVSGGEKPEDWLPVSVVCEKCGNIGTTKAHTWDGEKVTYTCEENIVSWAQGCGYKGEVSPFDGAAKLPWKVEWPAKWVVYGVDIEGGGKDHSTRGGSRDIANHIAREVFDYTPPFDIPYEFFLVGGKKMSSSKGEGSSAREVADLLPTKIFRLALLDKKPMSAINFDPAGDTVPILFDRYDALAKKKWDGEEDDNTRLFELLHKGDLPAEHHLPRFSLVSFLSQMPHIDIEGEIEKEKEASLTTADKEEINERVAYAQKWLNAYAPERYVYKLAEEEIPEGTKDFTGSQKKALAAVLEYVQQNEILDGATLHEKIHDIKQEQGIEPKELFSALYQSFLGRDSGPQAGWFLSVLPREFLITRLRECAE
jgi:lysyl-tRNA synthetase class 1